MEINKKLTPTHAYAKAITDYLVEQCKVDESLKTKIETKENNTVEGMMDYIFNYAKNQKTYKNCVMLKDDEVYKIAVDYWLDYEEGEAPKQQVAPKKEIKEETPKVIETKAPTKPKEEKKKEKEVDAIEKLYAGLDLFSMED